MAVINPPKLPSILLNKAPKGGYYVYTYQNIGSSGKLWLTKILYLILLYQ